MYLLKAIGIMALAAMIIWLLILATVGCVKVASFYVDLDESDKTITRRK